MMAYLLTRSTFLISAFLAFALPTLSQTWSSCNPLTQGSCPADPALGRTVDIDFSQGASDSFSASGAPSYGSNGAAFSIAQSGDSPTITSKWYIMFGHVDFVLKAAPGTGIVSSAILQSDDLDEIDLEWLGGDDQQVQSNYFGKGQTTTYNRGAFHAAPNNHDNFNTYSIDWTANQIVWSVNGQTVRVLTPDTANGQYPQTPMQIKVGVWAGGDPSNAAGTIQWAGGYVSYAGGPYTMYLKSIRVVDYSTGSSYSYSGTSGTWDSITSNGGSVNPSGNAGSSSRSVSGPTVSTASGAPRPFTTSPEQSSVYATRTGFPWVIGTASTMTTNSNVPTSYSGLPSGWIITSSGKVIPPSSGSTECPSTSYPSASASDLQSASDSEPTTISYPPTTTTMNTITSVATISSTSSDIANSVVTSFSSQSPSASLRTMTSSTLSASQSTRVPEAVSANQAITLHNSSFRMIAAYITGALATLVAI